MNTGLPDSRKQTRLRRHDRQAVTPSLTPHSSPLAPHRPVRGFTYIGLLIFIALMGIALAGTGVVWHTETLREKERELLFAGEQLRRAIGQYYERTPGAKQFPQSLEDLLLDRRYPNVQRYLRKVYRDPLTGEREWGLVRGPQGGIVGVHSLAETRPLKRSGFRRDHEDFAAAARHSDWKFVYRPAETAVPAAEGS